MGKRGSWCAALLAAALFTGCTAHDGGDNAGDGRLPEIRRAKCDDGGSCALAYTYGGTTVSVGPDPIRPELVTSTLLATADPTTSDVTAIAAIDGVDPNVGVAMQFSDGSDDWMWGEVYDSPALTREQFAMERAWAWCTVLVTPRVDGKCDEGGDASWENRPDEGPPGVHFARFADYVSQIDAAVTAAPDGDLAWRSDPIDVVRRTVMGAGQEGAWPLDRCHPTGYYSVCEVRVNPTLRFFGEDLVEVDLAVVTALPSEPDLVLEWSTDTSTIELHRVGRTWWIDTITSGPVTASGSGDAGQREVRAAVADFTVDLPAD